MAHHGMTRADLGAWSVGSLSAAELFDFDTKIFKSLNADDGGSWSPAATIVLGGLGITLTGCFTANPVASLFTFATGVEVDVATGAVWTWSGNASCTFNGTSTLVMETGTQLVTMTGSQFRMLGSSTMTAGTSTTVDLNGAVNFDGVVIVESGATFTVDSGGTITAPAYALASQSIVRTYGPTSFSGDWVLASGLFWWTTTVDADNFAVFMLNDLPHGATITAMTVYINPASHAALPANMPSLDFYKKARSTGTTTSVVAGVDDPSNLAIYPNYHGWSLAGLAEVIDCDANEYFAVVHAENGADSEINMMINSLVVTMTVTSVDPG